ncbi:MAG: hypothetical protein LZT29_03501 [Pantoea stewartii]|nr:MAG: hypothetical protein LZT29_03501 [Pantoea stewartii]
MSLLSETYLIVLMITIQNSNLSYFCQRKGGSNQKINLN